MACDGTAFFNAMFMYVDTNVSEEHTASIFGVEDEDSMSLHAAFQPSTPTLKS
jgi:hypothetical protein